MSKDEYINAMSGVHPSEQTIERIMDMTSKRKIRGLRKGLVGVLVALAILICGGLTANAATDGAVADAIDKGISSIKVFVNGKEADEKDVISSEKEYVNDNGEKVKEYYVEVPDGSSTIEIIEDEDGVEWTKEGTGAEIVIQTDDFKEPTTVVTE